MTQELITMTPRELARYEIIKRLLAGEINGSQASKQTGLSVRQVKNIKARVKAEGARGIIHKNRGRNSNRKLPEPFIQKVESIVRERYYDFGPKFASEKLVELHQIKVNKETLRQLMTAWGLWQVHSRKKTKEYRAWRDRKKHYGEMEQFDGSYFQMRSFCRASKSNSRLNRLNRAICTAVSRNGKKNIWTKSFQFIIKE